MKKEGTRLLFLITTFTVFIGSLASANGFNQNKDSTYYSFYSHCNILLKVTKNKMAILVNNNVFEKGDIVSTKGSDYLLHFKLGANNKFSFYFLDSDLVVFNSKNELNCIKVDSIVLENLVNDANTLSKIKRYFKNSESNDYDVLNQKAIFFEKIKFYKTTKYILKQMIKTNPDKPDGYLHLADMCWNFRRKTEAKKRYSQYIALMESKKKAKKIVKRAHERTDVAINQSKQELQPEKPAENDGMAKPKPVVKETTVSKEIPTKKGKVILKKQKTGIK